MVVLGRPDERDHRRREAEPGGPLDLGDRRVVRTKRWLLENNAPGRPGRLYDCGASRDGAGYRDVTDSQDPEVVAARKWIDEILADKLVPKVNDGPAPKRPRRQAKPTE